MNLPADPASDAMMKYTMAQLRTSPIGFWWAPFCPNVRLALPTFWQTAPETDLLMAAYDRTRSTAHSSQRLVSPIRCRF